VPTRQPSTRRAPPLTLLVALFLLGPLATACTTTHSARTVGAGNLGIEASLGGPMMANLGPMIPVPNLMLGARYGILQDLDVSGAFNVTAPVIPGIGLDLQTSLHWIPIQPGVRSQAITPTRGWSLGGTVGATWLTDFRTGFVVVPHVDAVGGFRHEWFSVFWGTGLGLNFFRPMGGRDVPMLSPYVGIELILSPKIAVSLRVTWHDVTHNAWGSGVQWAFMTDDDATKRAYAPLGISLGFSGDVWLRKKKDRATADEEDRP